MPSFDVVSEIDLQEVRNAVDQASRETSTRYDLKDSGTELTLDDKAMTLTLETASDDKVRAVRQVIEEKFVKRNISLKSLEWADPEEASKGRVRVRISLKAGINSDMAKKINTHIKNMKLKGVQSQTQGDQVRVTGKKRDDLQTIIASLREADLDLPLQFENFRD